MMHSPLSFTIIRRRKRGVLIALLVAFLFLTATYFSSSQHSAVMAQRWPGYTCRIFNCRNRCRYGFWRDRCGCPIRCRCLPRPCRRFNCIRRCRNGQVWMPNRMLVQSNTLLGSSDIAITLGEWMKGNDHDHGFMTPFCYNVKDTAFLWFASP